MKPLVCLLAAIPLLAQGLPAQAQERPLNRPYAHADQLLRDLSRDGGMSPAQERSRRFARPVPLSLDRSDFPPASSGPSPSARRLLLFSSLAGMFMGRSDAVEWGDMRFRFKVILE